MSAEKEGVKFVPRDEFFKNPVYHGLDTDGDVLPGGQVVLCYDPKTPPRTEKEATNRGRGGEFAPPGTPENLAAIQNAAAKAYVAAVEAKAILEKGLPIPWTLYCPECGEMHIDEGEWATRPHKTHQCQKCKHEWRPFSVPTVGVAPATEPKIVHHRSCHTCAHQEELVDCNDCGLHNNRLHRYTAKDGYKLVTLPHPEVSTRLSTGDGGKQYYEALANGGMTGAVNITGQISEEAIVKAVGDTHMNGEVHLIEYHSDGSGKLVLTGGFKMLLAKLGVLK